MDRVAMGDKPVGGGATDEEEGERTLARPALSDGQLAAAAAAFDLLSAPSRLRLVWLLAAGEYDVSTLAALSGTNVPAASQHLAKLRSAGIVKARRSGRRQLYRVEDPHILTVIDHMVTHLTPEGTLAGLGGGRRAS